MNRDKKPNMETVKIGGLVYGSASRLICKAQLGNGVILSIRPERLC